MAADCVQPEDAHDLPAREQQYVQLQHRCESRVPVWEFPTNSGILAPPTSFLMDGKQYIANESGWGGFARRSEYAEQAFSGRVSGSSRGRRGLGFWY
jgi:hypothetical protein